MLARQTMTSVDTSDWSPLSTMEVDHSAPSSSSAATSPETLVNKTVDRLGNDDNDIHKDDDMHDMRATEANAGVASLLLMRRRAHADKRVNVMPSPAPLHQTAIKSNKTALQLAMLPNTGNIPSSHPYYRSLNVLATPRAGNPIGQSHALAAAVDALHSARAVKSPSKPRLPYATMSDTPRLLKSPIQIDTRAKGRDADVSRGVSTSGFPNSLNTLCLTASAIETGFNRGPSAIFNQRRSSTDLQSITLRQISLGRHRASARIVLPLPPSSPTAQKIRHSRNRSDGYASRASLPLTSNLRFIDPRRSVSTLANEFHRECAHRSDIRDVQIFNNRVGEENLRRYAIPQTPHKESFLRGGRVESELPQGKRQRDSDVDVNEWIDRTDRCFRPRSQNGSRQPTTPLQSPTGECRSAIVDPGEHPSKCLCSGSGSASHRSSSSMSHRSEQELTSGSTSNDGIQRCRRKTTHVLPQTVFGQPGKPISSYTALSGNHRNLQTLSTPAERSAGQAPAQLEALCCKRPQQATAISSEGVSISSAARVIDLSHAPFQVHASSIGRGGYATIAPPAAGAHKHRVLIPPRRQLSVPSSRAFSSAVSAIAGRSQANGSILERPLAEGSSKAANQHDKSQVQSSSAAGRDEAALALEQAAAQLAEAARKLREPS